MNQRRIYFAVEDTGCGISKEDIPKLFKIFGRLETKHTSRVNQTGIGLGLAISQMLVQLLNAKSEGQEIKVKSELNKGSCFYFSIVSLPPLANGHIRADLINTEDLILEEDLQSPQDLPKNLVYNSSFLTGSGIISMNDSVGRVVKILLVDDDQINMMVLRRYLRNIKNLAFDEAYNGQEAFNKFQNHIDSFNSVYDMILMDCNMPVMDGFEATQKINEVIKTNNLPAVPIIASTANASNLDYENCFKAGMTGYLSKPYKRSELIDKIEKTLNISLR